MLFTDQKFVTLVGRKLQSFRRVSPKAYNCRCPLCGDSKTNRSKARGYLIERNQSFSYYCHNCSASLPLHRFLEQIDPELATMYQRELYMEKATTHSSILPVKDPPIEQFSWPRYLLDSPIKELKKISQLRHDHPAKLYVIKRKIPPKLHSQLFYAPNFNKWVNSFIPKKMPDILEPRLVIPFIDKKNNLVGFTGRSFGNENLRYVTVMINDSSPKIYGLDRVNLTKTTYILEGPIDSMFIENSIAMAGTGIENAGQLAGIDPSRCVMVYDNEPRNKDIVKKMRKLIKKGWSVCIWPESIKEKDVNDMVLAGMQPEAIMNIIKENTCSGLEASLRLETWKKT